MADMRGQYDPYQYGYVPTPQQIASGGVWANYGQTTQPGAFTAPPGTPLPYTTTQPTQYPATPPAPQQAPPTQPVGGSLATNPVQQSANIASQPSGQTSTGPQPTASMGSSGFQPWKYPGPPTTGGLAGNAEDQLSEGFRFLNETRGQVPYLQAIQDFLAKNIYQDVEHPEITMQQFTPALQELARQHIMEPAAARGILNSSITGENMMRLLPEVAMNLRNTGLNRATQLYPAMQADVSRVFDPVFQGTLAGELTKRYGITPPTPSLLGGFLGGIGSGIGGGLSSLFNTGGQR